MEVDNQTSPIGALPNELLSAILISFPSKNLLPLTGVSRRFHGLVARILRNRLLATACLPDNQLILECYHPSAKISTPYLSCQFQGLKERADLSSCLPDNLDGESIEAQDLSEIYSSFRPQRIDDDDTSRRRVWFSRLAAFTTIPRNRQEDDFTATQDVFLDEGELFSQLCAVTNVVKEGPRKGTFVSHVNISDGVIRVWRQWLLHQATGSTPNASEKLDSDSESILWVDVSKVVGIRCSVAPAPAERMPLISGPEDEPPITYTLTYEELLVRSSKLLMAVEQSTVQELAPSRGAIIIAGI